MDNFTKQPNEVYTISIDFSNVLDDDNSETISTYTLIAYLSTTDVTSTVIDTSTNDTTTVRIRVKAGTTGNKYKITTLVTTNLGNVYEKDVLMKVCEI